MGQMHKGKDQCVLKMKAASSNSASTIPFCLGTGETVDVEAVDNANIYIIVHKQWKVRLAFKYYHYKCLTTSPIDEKC